MSKVRSVAFLLILVACSAASIACGANLAPVLNVQRAQVVTATAARPSLEQVRQVIVTALAARRWRIDEDTPGHLKSTVTSGGHAGSIAIDYDTATYSITLLSASPGLHYDGSYIHRRYNHWVNQLDRSITKGFASIQGGTTATGAPPVEALPPPPPAPSVSPPSPQPTSTPATP